MRALKYLGVGVAAALAVAWGAGTAQANLITTENASTTTINIINVCSDATNCTFNGSPPPSPLSANATLSDFVWTDSNTTLTFQVVLSASASNPIGEQLVAFGFDTTPVATASGGGDGFNVFTDQEFSGGFGHITMCASSGPSCGGGANSGLNPGDTATFDVTLSGISTPGSIDLGSTNGGPELYDFKYAGAFSSFESQSSACTPGAPGCINFQEAPEPASLILLGSALLGFGAVARRRRRT